MKFTTLFSASVASLGLLAAASAQDAVKFNVPGVTAPSAQPAQPAPQGPVPSGPAAAAPAAPGAKKFTDTQIVEAYGWFMGAQMGLRQLEFSKEQIEAMSRGLLGVATGANPPFNPQEIGPEVEAFMQRKQEAFMGKLKVAQQAASVEFFNTLKANKNVIELPSGLRYEVLKAGTGPVAKMGQVVSVNYTGSLVNGQVFDSSEQGQPAELRLQIPSPQSPEGIIPGMVEGLQKTGVGGKLKLYIPAQLAYGDRGVPGIPPGATLIFEVEIVSVKDAPPVQPAPAAK